MADSLSSRRAAWILLALTSFVSAAEKPPLVDVKGGTIVAFFPPVSEAELQRNPGTNEALGDFQVYATRVRGPFKNAGIEFDELYAHSFRIRIGNATTTFRPRKVNVGYYFVAPGKKPRVQYGVMTDDDLYTIANEYFGTHLK